MQEVLKELPSEILDAIRGKLDQMNKESLPPAYKDRFKAEAKHLKRTEEGDGLDTVITTEGTNVMIDFGAPVQVLGLTLEDAQAFISMLMDSLKPAMLADLVRIHDKAKAN